MSQAATKVRLDDPDIKPFLCLLKCMY